MGAAGTLEAGAAEVGVLGGVRGPDVLGDGDLAGQGGSDGSVVEQGGAGGVGRAQGDVALQVGVRGEDLAGKVPDDAQGRHRRGGHTVRAQDSAVDGCGAAVGCRDETQGEAGAGEGGAGIGDDDLAVHPPGQQRQRPRQDGGGDPVGALLLTAGHGWEGRGGVECAGERVGEGHGVSSRVEAPWWDAAGPAGRVACGPVCGGRRWGRAPRSLPRAEGPCQPDGGNCPARPAVLGPPVSHRRVRPTPARDIRRVQGHLCAAGCGSRGRGPATRTPPPQNSPAAPACTPRHGIVPGRRGVSPWMREGRVNGAGRDGRTDDRRH